MNEECKEIWKECKEKIKRNIDDLGTKEPSRNEFKYTNIINLIILFGVVLLYYKSFMGTLIIGISMHLAALAGIISISSDTVTKSAIKYSNKLDKLYPKWIRWFHRFVVLCFNLVIVYICFDYGKVYLGTLTVFVIVISWIMRFILFRGRNEEEENENEDN